MSAAITVLLADDHAVVRSALRKWLAAEPDLNVVAEVGHADEIVEAALACRPQVAVLDVDMPGRSSFAAAEELHRKLPETRILFLSGFCQDRYIAQALAIGASGYVLKTEPAENVAAAVRTVAAGGVALSTEVRARVNLGDEGARLRSAGVQVRGARVTERENEVLQLIARGLSKKEIAAELHLSERTVNCHCASLMAKLDIHDRVQLARYAIREGLVQA